MRKDNNKREKSPRQWFYRWWVIGTIVVFVVIVVVVSPWAIRSILFDGKTPSEILSIQNKGFDADELIMSEPKSVEIDNTPSLGDETAEVVIVEFLDFTNPQSREVSQTIRDVVSEYGSLVKLVHRDFPDPNNELSIKLAEAAHCADEQGYFWLVRDRIFVNQNIKTDEQIKEFIKTIGLDLGVFTECYNSRSYREIVLNDYQNGLEIGVSETPTFFFNGRMVEGLMKHDDFYEVLELFLPGVYPEYPADEVDYSFQ
ncbi:DsbA family protein [Patescibacteria group bacterium]|nr:DsbA family protein [Patescibacteria group bacterium]MBU1890932.1 DsbA family protein [Patescibacteria group bacterium]